MMRTDCTPRVTPDIFPIIGWDPLPAALSRPETMAHIRDCGINVFMTCRGPREAITRQLDLAAAAGIQALVCDPRVHTSRREGWQDAFRAAVAEYGAHPAVFGWDLFDEPTFSEWQNRPTVPDVAETVALARALAREKVAYVNALGFGGRGKDAFADYLEGYARIIQPAFLSFDCYPISRIPPAGEWAAWYAADCGFEVPELGAYYRDCYWESWETALQVGRATGLPLWGFVLAVPHEHSIWFYGPVTEGTVRLEVFTALAYGAKAIQYFSLPTPAQCAHYEDAILDADGRPSARYDIFRRVNRRLALLGPRMRDFTVRGVYHTGERLPSGTRRFRAERYGSDSSHRPVARIEGDPIIASFQADAAGERYLLLVNRHPARAARVQLTLDDGWQAIRIGAHTGEPVQTAGPRLAVNFEPGDGWLFQLRPAAG